MHQDFTKLLLVVEAVGPGDHQVVVFVKSLISLRKLAFLGSMERVFQEGRPRTFGHSSINELMHTRVGALSLVRK